METWYTTVEPSVLPLSVRSKLLSLVIGGVLALPLSVRPVKLSVPATIAPAAPPLVTVT